MYIISMFPEVHFLKLDGQVLTFDQIHFLPSLVSIQHLYSRGPREIDIYSWLERLLSTIALYLTCLKQIK